MKLSKVMAAVLLICMTGCSKRTDETPYLWNNNRTSSTYTANRECIYQVSLLQGLMLGDYNGSVTAGQLKKMGNTGIGTFDGANGELIMADGVIYRAAGDGTVTAVKDEETIPFADVTFFDNDTTEIISDIPDMTALRALLDERVEAAGKNRFYVIQIKGSFPKMNVRSEYGQKPPYRPLNEVLETDQAFYDYEDVTGTVVGLYCPVFMKDLNAVGWHLHFVSEDHTKGGHVLELSVSEADISWDYTDGFSMALPDNEMFSSFDLGSEDISKAEE